MKYLALIALFSTACATANLPMVKADWQKGQECVTYERATCVGKTGTPYECYMCRTGDVEGEPSDHDVER